MSTMQALPTVSVGLIRSRRGSHLPTWAISEAGERTCTRCENRVHFVPIIMKIDNIKVEQLAYRVRRLKQLTSL